SLNAVERDQNQVKNHQNKEQQPRVLFGSVFGPVSQRHEISGRGRDGETEKRRNGETERRENRGVKNPISPSLCLSIPLSLCPSISAVSFPMMAASCRPSGRASADRNRTTSCRRRARPKRAGLRPSRPAAPSPASSACRVS